MKKLIRHFLSSSLLLLFLSSCSTNSNEDLFQYKGSNIGDNSAVVNIIKQLPHKESFKQVSLQTKKEPYGMVLKYEKSPMSEKFMKETVITNVTYIFALVKNAEWITCEFGDQKYTVTREKLLEWYGKDVRNFKNEDDLQNLTQKYYENENKINQLFE